MSYTYFKRTVVCGGLATLGIVFLGAFADTNAQARQLSLADILIALRSKKAVIEEKNRILADAVKDRGITFTLTPEIEKELETTGAYKILIDAIRVKTTPATVAEIKQPEVKPAEIKPIVVQPTFESYRQSAAQHIEKGALELGISDLTKAIDLRPNDASAHADRAKANVVLEKYELAITDMNKAIEIEPRAAWFEFRAQVNEKLKRTDAAVSDYKRAVELDAANQNAVNSLKRIELENRKPEPVKVEPVKVDPPKAEPTSVVATTPQSTPEVPAGPPDVGPLNLFASRMAQPAYTDLDRRMGLQGKVVVQVTLDERGKVIEVQATSGPKGLRRAAEDAVNRSKFNPVVVEGAPAKVTGYIVFNFIKN
ncbi:MAG TPA: TonB family protein [Pyrinomonadaceae bacterium]|nr:TonB family protein [Pyrinomonadaceae bacterium]